MYRKLWIAWSLFGLGSLIGLLAAQELGVDVTPRMWLAWAAPGLGSFAALELYGVFRRKRDDTFSELVWSTGQQRSLFVFACLWGAYALFTGDVWPSFGGFALAWCAWHFWREGPYGKGWVDGEPATSVDDVPG